MDSQSSNICLFCKNIMFDIINICLFCKSIICFTESTFACFVKASCLTESTFVCFVKASCLTEPGQLPTCQDLLHKQFQLPHSQHQSWILNFLGREGCKKKKYGFLAQKVHCLTKFYWGASDFAYYIVDLWNLCCQFSVEPSPSFLTDVLLLHHKVICGRIRSVIMPQRPTIIAPHLHCFTRYGWTLETKPEH